MQSQLVSAAATLVGITATRIMANRMMMTGREEVLMSASFCFVEIGTFQSIEKGMVIHQDRGKIYSLGLLRRQSHN